jgi:lysozyme
VSPNSAAFLRVIREGESSQDARAFYLIVYGSTFQSTADHPRIHFDRDTHKLVENWRSAPPMSTTSAAGAFQITETTWDRFTAAVGPRDFSPESQGECALWLIKQRGALEDVEAGRLEIAIFKCRNEWTSLPGANENSGRYTLAKAALVFQQYGGTLAGQTQPAAPIEDRSTTLPAQPEKPMGAAAIFLPMIMQLIPQLFKIPGLQGVVNAVPTTGAAGGSPHASDYIPLVSSIIDTFTKAVPGAVNTQQAVELAQSDPKVAAMAAQAVLASPSVADELNKLLPVLDRLNEYDRSAFLDAETSRNAAATRGIQQQDSGPIWGNPTFLIAVMVMILVYLVVYAVLFRGSFSTDMQAFVIGAIVGGALTAVLGFYLGSSRNSAAKDATIAQLANKGTA